VPRDAAVAHQSTSTEKPKRLVIMNPIDLRNETFESLQSRVTGLRLMVLGAWREHGAGTTRELAARVGMDILAVRPRTTELVDLGFVRLVSRQGHEGVYAAVSDEQVRALFLAQQTGRAVQTEMPLC